DLRDESILMRTACEHFEALASLLRNHALKVDRAHEISSEPDLAAFCRAGNRHRVCAAQLFWRRPTIAGRRQRPRPAADSGSLWRCRPPAHACGQHAHEDAASERLVAICRLDFPTKCCEQIVDRHASAVAGIDALLYPSVSANDKCRRDRQEPSIVAWKLAMS